MFERIGPTFERKKSYVWAQKIHDWAHFTLAIYLRKKRGGGEFYLWILQLNKCYVALAWKLLRLLL